MSADCPTAAAACFSGIERGRCRQRQARHAGGDGAGGHEHDLAGRRRRSGGDVGGERGDAAALGARRRASVMRPLPTLTTSAADAA